MVIGLRAGEGGDRAPVQQCNYTPEHRAVSGDNSFSNARCAVRIAIAGSGVIGLLTAVNCVSAGHDVVLLDQAAIPSAAATSSDLHRVLRTLHDDPSATAAAVRSHRRWIDLEHLLSTRFYEQVGALTVLPADQVPAARAVLDGAGSWSLVLNSGELASSYPQVRFPAGASAIFELLAGVLLADRILAACVAWLRRHSLAELRPHARVVSVAAGRNGPAVRLAGGEVLRADGLLLATGPWSRPLLAPELASELVLHRQSMIYCQVPAPEAAAWSAAPSIRSLGADGGTWLVPPSAGTPLKLSDTSVCRVVPEVGDNTTPPHWRDKLIGKARLVIPGFDPGWVTGARDYYYLGRGPGGGPMLAVLADQVLAYAACGGSSFKFAPLIAQSLAERLTGAEPAPTGLHAIDGGAVHASHGTAAATATSALR
jgi:sarcosine oxidase